MRTLQPTDQISVRPQPSGFMALHHHPKPCLEITCKIQISKEHKEFQLSWPISDLQHLAELIRALAA